MFPALSHGYNLHTMVGIFFKTETKFLNSYRYITFLMFYWILVFVVCLLLWDLFYFFSWCFLNTQFWLQSVEITKNRTQYSQLERNQSGIYQKLLYSFLSFFKNMTDNWGIMVLWFIKKLHLIYSSGAAECQHDIQKEMKTKWSL